ncbi:MAG TPA: cysteine hydrolase family protein [Rhizomicrobium sp.]
MGAALVVIDVQKVMFASPQWIAHDGEAVVDRIAGLIAKARAAGVPVLFVQHHALDEAAMQPGAPGFDFVDKLAPAPGEDVTVKHRSSAFHGTDFDAKLKRAGIDHLIVTGMQSEYCVDSAIRGAVERGYKVTLVADAHSTFDSKVAKAKDIIAIQNDTMGDSFASVVPAAQVRFL